MENSGDIFHLLTTSGVIMEKQTKFKPNPSLQLMGQVTVFERRYSASPDNSAVNPPGL